MLNELQRDIKTIIQETGKIKKESIDKMNLAKKSLASENTENTKKLNSLPAKAVEFSVMINHSITLIGDEISNASSEELHKCFSGIDVSSSW
jgi:hypothetical protein